MEKNIQLRTNQDEVLYIIAMSRKPVWYGDILPNTNLTYPQVRKAVSELKRRCLIKKPRGVDHKMVLVTSQMHRVKKILGDLWFESWEADWEKYAK